MSLKFNTEKQWPTERLSNFVIITGLDCGSVGCFFIACTAYPLTIWPGQQGCEISERGANILPRGAKTESASIFLQYSLNPVDGGCTRRYRHPGILSTT